MAQKGNQYTLLSEKGYESAKITGRFRYDAKQVKDYPVVGDFVIVHRLQNESESTINERFKRKNSFTRKMPISGGRKMKNGVIDGGITEEQVIAANIDTVFIMCSLDSNFNSARLERYLILTKRQNLKTIIVLTKLDLCTHPDQYLVRVKEITKDVPAIAVSAVNHVGLEHLKTHMIEGKTLLLLGSSGVGKSTLLNALVHQQIQKTKPISLHSGKGKHTTTHKQIFFHPTGCMIVDTPGMKELQLWADEEDLACVYQDIIDLTKTCRYSNCTHHNEPGCAIRQAIHDGILSEERYQRYESLQKEIRRLSEKKKEYSRNKMKRRKRI